MKTLPASLATIASLGLSIWTATAALAATGERLDFVNQPGGQLFLNTVELDAGAVVLADPIDLGSLTPFAVPGILALERIGDEVWLGTINGVLRYGGSPFSYIGQSFAGEVITAMTPTSFGAVLGSSEAYIEVDPASVETRRVGHSSANLRDIDTYQGGYLSTAIGAVERLDLDFAFQEVFALEAYTIAT